MQTLESGLKTTILLSKPEEDIIVQNENITFVSHADDTQMSALIQSAEIIISRPGYSTIMDLCMFGKKAIFIPTPGQTEQEYLAKRIKSKGYCYFENQKSFSLERALAASKKYTGMLKMDINSSWHQHIDNLLSED